MLEEKSSQRSSFTIFAVGALIGAGIALLYAPVRKGNPEAARQEGHAVQKQAQDTIESAQEYIKDKKADLVAAVVDTGKEIVDQAKHKRT